MFQTGGFPDLDLSFLFCPFWDFPDFSGIFPICSGMVRGFSRLSFSSFSAKSTYEEQSRKGPRHNLDLSPKKVGNTRVWKPPGLASPKRVRPQGAPAKATRAPMRWVFFGGRAECWGRGRRVVAIQGFQTIRAQRLKNSISFEISISLEKFNLA